jgi:two-component system phosphate regulon sensor histidine kinase PhoR
VNRKILRIILILATISLSGIMAIQIYWVKKAFNLEESQFNQRVHVAMTNVAKEILTINKETSELYEPVKQIGSNYFIASINDTLHPYLLRSLLKHEFDRRNIDIDFEYVIYDCFTDSIVYSNYVSAQEDEESQESSNTKGLEWQRDGHYFGVYFPSKQSYLANQMGIWVFSTSVLLFVMIYFAYTTFVILRQKKLSEIRRDFINNLTHELKTPISTISLSTEVLLNSETQDNKERVAHYAEIIRQENNRLKIQVEKVLQLSALDVKSIVLNQELKNVHPLLLGAVKGFGLILKEKNGSINTSLKA